MCAVSVTKLYETDLGLMESAHTDPTLGQFLLYDIAQHALHGLEFIFDRDVTTGLPFCLQTSRDSTCRSDGRTRVYRWRGERYHDACVVEKTGLEVDQ